MTIPTTQLDKDEMEALIDEMSITIKNLASLAAAHGLMDPYVNHHLHEAIDGDVTTKSIDETLGVLKKVNEGSVKEWSFLHLG